MKLKDVRISPMKLIVIGYCLKCVLGKGKQLPMRIRIMISSMQNKKQIQTVVVTPRSTYFYIL
jgi:hypothetical protein